MIFFVYKTYECVGCVTLPSSLLSLLTTQDLTTSETPYFCHSHLVMKINVGAPDAAAAVPNLAAFNTELRSGPLPLDLIQASSACGSAGLHLFACHGCQISCCSSSEMVPDHFVTRPPWTASPA